MRSGRSLRWRVLLPLVCLATLAGAGSASAAGDLSRATLEASDLPSGFRSVSENQLSEAGISAKQVGRGFVDFLTDARLLAYSVHATPRGDEVVESFLVGPLSPTEQQQIDSELADRQSVIDSLSGAFMNPWAETQDPQLLGTDGVGDSSLGFRVVMTTSSGLVHLESLFGGATGDRASVALVFGRRGEYLEFVAAVHLGAGKPRANVVQLARTLDGKVGYGQGIEGFGPDGQTSSGDGLPWLPMAIAAAAVVLVGGSAALVRRRRRAASSPLAAVMASRPFPIAVPAAMAKATVAAGPTGSAIAAAAPTRDSPPRPFAGYRALYFGEEFALSLEQRPTGARYVMRDLVTDEAIRAFPATTEGWASAWATFIGLEPDAEPYVDIDAEGMGSAMGSTSEQVRAGFPSVRSPISLPAAPSPQMGPTTTTHAGPGRATGRARVVGRLVRIAGWLMVIGWLVGVMAFSSESEGMAALAWGKSSIAVYSPPVLQFAWGIPLIVLGSLMGRTKGRGAADERIEYPPQRIGRRLVGLGIGALPLVGMAFLSFFLVTGTIREDGADVQLGAWVGLGAAILGLVGAVGAIVVGIGLRRRPTAVASAAAQQQPPQPGGSTGLPPAPPPVPAGPEGVA